jgi:hypothetical protein
VDGRLTPVAYATLDDNLADHPKVFSLSDAAFRLHVSGIIYCARQRTDGNVPGEKVKALVPRFRPSALQELVARGMWMPILDGAAYNIHDYLDWNLSRAQIEARRESRSKSGRRGAEKRWAS